MTALYSILHLMVDGVCALAMAGRFLSRPGASPAVLLYNFCAFALQMPLGVLLDLLPARLRGSSRKRLGRSLPFLFASLGILLVCLGAVLHPVILGIGNALFHIGGGVETIRADRSRDRKGRDLGIFVAPGAIGLYLGMSLGKTGGPGLLAAACLLTVLLWTGAVLYRRRHPRQLFPGRMRQTRHSGLSDVRGFCLLGVCCFAVVILRGYLGMSVSFPWKTGFREGLLLTLAVALGKAAGGFLSARFGCLAAAGVSLAGAALCYLFPGSVPAGLAAAFLFNITMPITLYLLICRQPALSGFSFGLLTFGLFLGFLPVFFGAAPPFSGPVMGCAGSLLSLVILGIGLLSGGRRGSLSD